MVRIGEPSMEHAPHRQGKSSLTDAVGNALSPARSLTVRSLAAGPFSADAEPAQFVWKIGRWQEACSSKQTSLRGGR